jgi:hypothetical protein
MPKSVKMVKITVRVRYGLIKKIPASNKAVNN